jgi:hydrogenase maturation protease
MSELGERIGALARGRRTAVVGVGNRLRGDDAIGSLVAARLAGRVAAPVVDAETVPENYLDVLLDSAAEVVLFVDAADHGGAPGEWCLAPAAELVGSCTSTHAMSLRLLCRALAERDVACWLIGIQPGCAVFDEPLSPAVAEGAGHVEAALFEALGASEVLRV